MIQASPVGVAPGRTLGHILVSALSSDLPAGGPNKRQRLHQLDPACILDPWKALTAGCDGLRRHTEARSMIRLDGGAGDFPVAGMGPDNKIGQI